jgi:hypothetical protein
VALRCGWRVAVQRLRDQGGPRVGPRARAARQARHRTPPHGRRRRPHEGCKALGRVLGGRAHGIRGARLWQRVGCELGEQRGERGRVVADGSAAPV